MKKPKPKKQMATVATGQFATIEAMLNYSTARAEKVLAKAKGLELK
jgi:hypothetical protein